MTIILSTCGTSILTNDVDEALRTMLTRHANSAKEEAIRKENPEEYQTIAAHIQDRKSQFRGYAPQKAAEKSAELNGILAYYEGRLPPGANDVHYLLATDTWLGEATADIARGWLETNGIKNCQVIRHPDLQTADWPLFRSSLSGLVKWCAETIAPQRSPHCRVVFNLSGGFKSETGFLQTLGMFYADETIYMFERSGQLMRIPRLPARLEAKEDIEKDLADFRRAALGLSVTAAKAGIYWFGMDGEFTLEPWGEMVFEEHKNAIYKEKILPPPTDAIRFGLRFLDSCKNISGKQRRQINRALDLLAQCKESPNHPNPNSLHYQPIRQPPSYAPDASHEIYAWNDGDARRIFCRELAGGVTELICLGPHLR
ncbi:MAG: hypothetical protein LBU53_11030 [Zoogloeaceae bacterium]|jgi:putative CRISPR-associated protein (TIGR02619 family)|nr:hypothetical protein [Zoogloeaceae bacterium]